MLTLSLFVRLEAKPGKEEALAAFLMQGLQLANQESTTPLWFALRLGPTTFAIFDAFRDEAGRQGAMSIAQTLGVHMSVSAISLQDGRQPDQLAPGEIRRFLTSYDAGGRPLC